VARIIVVDDSAEIRSVLRTVLELEGYEVVEAEDGTEALAMPLTREDIVLLDVMMPDVDGYGVLAGLRARGEQMPRVIMVTAKSGEFDRQRALSRGALGFITKPFDIEDVIKEIQLVLSKGEDELAERRDHEIYLSRLISQLERLPRND
jgi:two-component system, OmpR family, response regulator